MNLEITLLFISVLLVIMLGLLIWFIRIALNKKSLLANQPTIQPDLKKHKRPTSHRKAKPKYVNSKLKNDEKERFLEKIIQLMEVDKIYRQADLTIDELANIIGVSKNYLSQTINEKTRGSLWDFVNRYRIEEAKKKLQDASMQTESLIAIGKKVGFKAKSTFYVAFKKYTGSTPGDFRKEAQKLNSI